MQEQRAKEVERVFVAVDVQNLWYSCREEFGDGARVRYRQLIDLIRSGNRELLLHAYLITANTKIIRGKTKFVGRQNSRFIESLQELGFVVRDRSVIREKNANNPFGTDWDMGIAIEAIKRIEEFDTYILVSGDGDFNILLEELRKQGKRVEVVTFKSTKSVLLHRPAHKITHLTADQVFYATRRAYGTNQTDSG